MCVGFITLISSRALQRDETDVDARQDEATGATASMETYIKDYSNKY